MSAEAVTVVHTVASLTPNSGVTPVIRGYLQDRANAGLSSVCIYFDEPGTTREQISHLSEKDRSHLVPVARPAAPWAQYAAFGQILANTLSKLQANGHSVIVHDHGLWLPSNLATSTVARQLDCRYIVSPHGMLQPQAMAYASLKKRLAWLLYEKRRLQKAAALHVTSNIEAQSVARQLPSANLIQVPIGISLPQIPPRDRPRRQDVIYLGRLSPIKGISMLIKAWQLAKQAGWHLRLVGPCDPAYLQQLRDEVAQLNVGDSVSFDGPLYGVDKQTLLLESHVLVLPSFSENFGMVVVEALAHGLPVITTNRTPWLSIPQKGCGWIVQPEASRLAEAIRSAMSTSANDAERMGACGRIWMKEDFDPLILARRMNEHYLELTGG
jgi:glycosyltransferase involved in cell wall biosynthesis